MLTRLKLHRSVDDSSCDNTANDIIYRLAESDLSSTLVTRLPVTTLSADISQLHQLNLVCAD